MMDKIIFPGGLLAGAGILIMSINWSAQFRVFSLESLFCETIRDRNCEKCELELCKVMRVPALKRRLLLKLDVGGLHKGKVRCDQLQFV
jgi:hypothetical protein